MLFLYNVIQIALFIIVGPLLFVKAILTPKYRGRIMKRLGIGLVALPRRQSPASGKRLTRIWVHALSVGEVSSARPLVLALRQAMPEVELLFSATTRTGEALAQSSLAAEVDHFVVYPLDCLLSVQRALSCYQPDIFILVETDFWPNFLSALKQRRIPAILVNGRISETSFIWYRRFKPLFKTIFASFSFLAVQTTEDARKMFGLGVASDRVQAIGNLKYDSALPSMKADAVAFDRAQFGIPAAALLLVAGSTHPGEEEIILPVFRWLLEKNANLFLVIAPRNIERGAAVAALAANYGLTAQRRTESPAPIDPQVLVLDTIGELAGLYRLCDVAFVGGSLVRQGGHNPLESACFGKPVLFGPHMDDFSEIARDLLLIGGAFVVADAASLQSRLEILIADEQERLKVGSLALALVNSNQGVAGRHVELIRAVLAEAGVV